MKEYKRQVRDDRMEWLNEDGQYHRLDGPAMRFEYKDVWYVNGNLHRLNGPAVEYIDGYKEWWIEGCQYSEEDFNKRVKEAESLCEGKIVEIDGKKYKLVGI